MQGSSGSAKTNQSVPHLGRWVACQVRPLNTVWCTALGKAMLAVMCIAMEEEAENLRLRGVQPPSHNDKNNGSPFSIEFWRC